MPEPCRAEQHRLASPVPGMGPSGKGLQERSGARKLFLWLSWKPPPPGTAGLLVAGLGVLCPSDGDAWAMNCLHGCSLRCSCRPPPSRCWVTPGCGARCTLTPFVLPIGVSFYSTRMAYCLAGRVGRELVRLGVEGTWALWLLRPEGLRPTPGRALDPFVTLKGRRPPSGRVLLPLCPSW